MSKKPNQQIKESEKTQGKPQEPNTGNMIEQRVKDWLLGRGIETKLAVILMTRYGIEDHGTKQLWCEVMDNYDKCLFDIVKHPEKYQPEEAFAAGICSEAIVWTNHY